MTGTRNLDRIGFITWDGRPIRAEAYRDTRYRAPYDAGSQTRRTHGWTASNHGPTTAIVGSLPTLRARARNEVRNNGWLRQAVRRLVANEVGAYIKPIFAHAPLQTLWDNWVDEADSRGDLNLYGILWQLATARRVAGEGFARLRFRRLSDGLTVPLQVETLEPEHCPLEKIQPAPGSRGDIWYGVEFDRLGKRVAYWLYPRHPNEDHRTPTYADLRRVPAGLVIHSFLPERPGQVRGVTDTTAGLLPAHIYHDYRDSERERKRSKAKMTAVLERDFFRADQGYPFDESWLYDPLTGESITSDAYTNPPMSDMEPGTIYRPLPGEKMKFVDGDDTGAGFADFQRWEALEIASGLGVPYEVVTGDFSRTSDRTYRAISDLWNRQSDMDRDMLTVFQVLRRIKDAFIEAAYLAGVGDLVDYETRRAEYHRVTYQPQGRPYLHRLQDVQADIQEWQAGLTSRTALCAKRGRSAEDIDRENRADEDRAEDLELQYRESATAPTPPEPPEQQPAQPDEDTA